MFVETLHKCLLSGNSPVVITIANIYYVLCAVISTYLILIITL